MVQADPIDPRRPLGRLDLHSVKWKQCGFEQGSSAPNLRKDHRASV